MRMQSKNTLFILLIIAAGVWFGFNKKNGGASFLDSHQHQMDKAQALQGKIQADADKRLQQTGGN
jgi:cell division protein FtsB